jgi:hypothetical protein
VDELRARQLVNRIVSGGVRLLVNGTWYFVAHPDREARCIMDEIYLTTIQDAAQQEVYTEAEILQWMREEGYWDDERERMRTTISEDIEKLKVGMYENRESPQYLKEGRRCLGVARQKLQDLEMQRNSYVMRCDIGMARMACLSFRIASSLCRNGKHLYPGEAALNPDPDLVSDVTMAWQEAQLGERDFRALARSSVWRSLWSCRKTGDPLFGGPVCDFTEDQQQLVAASQLYDNIHEHPECPPDHILEDDDLLDGWLILERRKHSKGRDEQDVLKDIRSEAIRNGQEVFIVAQGPDHARKIEGLNTPEAQAIIANRNKIIAEKGVVDDLELPDVKRRIQIERAKMRAASG